MENHQNAKVGLALSGAAGGSIMKLSETNIRTRALELANMHGHGEPPEKTVERARAYADFITGQSSPEAAEAA